MRYAILGMLSLGSMSGYDMKKFFGRNVGLFWNANFSQVYSQLHRLELEGLVKKTSVMQDGVPNKKVYTLTPLGEEELRGWLVGSLGTPDYRDEFQLKFFFSHLLDEEKMREHLLELADFIRGRLESLEKVTTGHKRALSPITLQGARYGVHYYRAYLDWIQETLNLLDSGELLGKGKSHRAGKGVMALVASDGNPKGT
ncbi:MAG: PadR family transcriptional regulator [Dehalococcoidia bacterium]|nr:PadR family transcriptional regulator [Dehalococcoidia bacterium]